MNIPAQNAFLKIFEEPPSYITIILITNGLSKILTTIKSRAVIYKFANLNPKELEIYLDKYYNNIDNKNIYANISGGSISKMIELISDNESLKFRDNVLDAFYELINNSNKTAINPIFDIFMKNKDLKNDIIKLMSLFVMDIAYIKASNENAVVNIDIKDKLEFLVRKLSISNVFNIQKILADLNEQLTKNSNYKLAVLNSILNIREEIHD